MLKRDVHDKMKLKQYEEKVKPPPAPNAHSPTSPRGHTTVVSCPPPETFHALTYPALVSELCDEFL